MKILITIGTLDLKSGGPAKFIVELAVELARNGFIVGVWAGDGSALLTPEFKNVDTITSLSGRFDDALRKFGTPDVVHDNGIWSPSNYSVSAVCNKRSLKRVVTIHGMLEPWAKNNKKLKKILAWNLYQRRSLQTARAIHFTSESEKNNANLDLGNKIFCIPCGVDVDQVEKNRTNLSDTKIMLYLGRLHPKKGLLMLLESWEIANPKGWQLQIVGPDEQNHREELARKIVDLQLGDTVKLFDPVFGASKQAVFDAASLFILPTYSENFGIAVVEALGNNIPVITTTGASPWKDLVQYNAGWWVDPTAESIGNAISEASETSPQILSDMGLAGSKLVRDKYTWSTNGKKYIEMYTDIDTN